MDKKLYILTDGMHSYEEKYLSLEEAEEANSVLEDEYRKEKSNTYKLWELADNYFD